MEYVPNLYGSGRGSEWSGAEVYGRNNRPPTISDFTG